MKNMKKSLIGSLLVVFLFAFSMPAFAATPRYPVDLCTSCMKGAMLPFETDLITDSWSYPCAHGYTSGEDIEQLHFVYGGIRCDFCGSESVDYMYEYTDLICFGF